MDFFPLIALDNEPYFNVESYVLANQRFLAKMGVDMVASTTPFIGLDQKPYFSARERQIADENYLFNLREKELSR